MNSIKQRIKTECCKRNMPVSNMLMTAGIQSGDYYLAINGKRPFYPGWRKRIADTLGLNENELFPEYEIGREE